MGLSVVVLVACSSDGGSGEGTSSESSTGTAETGEPCPIGALSCSCTQGGACDEGLQCVDGTCVAGDPPATTDDGEDDSSTDPTAADSTTEGPASTSDGSETGELVDLDAWTKRRPVILTNEDAVDLVDHQVKIDIEWDEDMAPLLADLRFTGPDDELLSHWTESMIAPVEGRIWVRVPLLPAGEETTIYMWYGNPEVDGTSDGAATFDLWEDFETLDETLWTATDDASVADGRLTISTGAVVSNAPMLALPGAILEMRARWPGPAGSSSGFTAASTQGNDSIQDMLQMTWSPFSFSATDGVEWIASDGWRGGPGAPSDQLEWNGLGMGAGLIRFSRTHEDGAGYQHDYEGDLPNDYYVWLGGAGGLISEGDECREIEIDLLLVRKFAETPPAVAVGAEEDL
jgi:hypothetical protein